MWTTLISLALAAAVCFSVAAIASGIQQIFGTTERITRERAALGGLGCAISHRRHFRKDFDGAEFSQ